VSLGQAIAIALAEAGAGVTQIFSSGEATTFSDNPQFGLRQRTLNEGVMIQNPFVDFEW